MSSPDAVTYVYYGDDEPTLKQQVEAFIAAMFESGSADLNTTRLDGKSIQPGEIEQNAGALPFLSDLRLVLVDNLTESSVSKDIIDKLPDILPALPDSTRLIFVETALQGRMSDSQAEQNRKSKRRTAVKKLVNVVENDARGMAVHFKVPDNALNWIRERAAAYGVRIDERAAHVLNERINNDYTLADSELAKLSTYVGGARAITLEDVNLLTPYSPEASIFKMVDALGERNGKQAIALFHQLLDDGSHELYILTMIARQYRLLIVMREQLDKGLTVEAAGKAMGVKGWLAKNMAKQARQYRLDLLEQIYRLLLETDLAIKTGRKPPRLALEQFIARLAR